MGAESTHERLHGSGPSVGSDRAFALVFAALFGAVATLPLLRGAPLRLWSLTLALGFLLVAVVRPQLAGPLNGLWFRLGLLLSRVTSPIFLALFFFGALTPFALLRRALGADALRLRRTTSDSTYWVVREGGATKPDSLRRQF
jgi:hypothetical protein